MLSLHHPPVPSVFDMAVLVELREQAGLAEVLRGTDVRAILGGHLHYSTTATFADIPVSVASSTCYTQDLNVPIGTQRPQDGAQSYNLVDVYPDTVVHSVVPAGAPATPPAAGTSPRRKPHNVCSTPGSVFRRIRISRYGSESASENFGWCVCDEWDLSELLVGQ